MDLLTLTSQLKELETFSTRMAEVLRAGRLAELLVSGAAVVIRPACFLQPGGKEVDPVFGLQYWDWLKFREEGFTGWQTTQEGSGRPKILIHTAQAEAWLEERRARQAAARPPGVGTRQSSEMRERWAAGTGPRPGRKRKAAPPAP